jgi:periplasmic divalent cation tolerance protein
VPESRKNSIPLRLLRSLREVLIAPSARRIPATTKSLDHGAGAVLSVAMQPAAKFKLVLVTAPDLRTARKLARAALQARLAACVNLVPKLESHFRWQGKVDRSPEVLLLFKTTNARLAGLEKLIVARHPYDTPEIIALSLSQGNGRYLNWLTESCVARS